MATKTPRNNVPPAGRPVQWKDLDKGGQQATAGLMQNWGNAKTNAHAVRARHEATRDAATERIGSASTQAETDVAKRSQVKAERNLGALDKVEPVLKDKNVTVATAANQRTRLAKASTERTQADGSASPLRDSGAGWYFDHHARLASVADSTGLPKDQVIAASAVMSPMNSPENEHAAVSSLAKLHSENPAIGLTPHARKALKVKGDSVNFADLNDKQVATLSTSSLRSHISGVDQETLTGLSKGGTKTNIVKAIGALRGNVAPADAIDPHSSPKVWSYHDSISKAEPGGAVHEEYLTRAQTALHEMPGQGTLDLFGKRSSREGILDPNKTTAEDTWQNAISSGQQLAGIPNGRQSLSPAKLVGSDKAMVDTGKVHEGVSTHPSGQVTQESVRHAWNNQATVQSARQLSRGTDVAVPSVVAQEVSWTEARREAGKDPQYAEAKNQRSQERKSHFQAGAGQGSLF